jgi:hypothetical protein
MHRACRVNDPACIVHAVAMTPHALLILLCIASPFPFHFSKLFEKFIVHAVFKTTHAPSTNFNGTAFILKKN